MEFSISLFFDCHSYNNNKSALEEVTKKYFERTEINIHLNREKEYIGEIRRIYEPDWILEYIGINLQEQLNLILDKFTGKTFNKYYNKSLQMYEFNFIEMLQDDKVNKNMKEIGLHDIIFNAYKEAKLKL